MLEIGDKATKSGVKDWGKRGKSGPPLYPSILCAQLLTLGVIVDIGLCCAAGQHYRGKVRFCLLHYNTCFANLAERFCFGIVNVPTVSYALPCPDSDSVIAQLLCSQQKDSGKNCLWGPVYEIRDTGSAATACMIGHICQQKIGDCRSRASHL